MDQQQLTHTLQAVFGYKEFRPSQFNAIHTLLTKGRVLSILPTGHGKSLLYQLPAYLLGGMTIVISPLLALMRDQIDHLNRKFKIPSASINSDQSPEENHIARQAAQRGDLRILFVAPEQLDQIESFDFLLSLPIKLFVVDEAHCISTWGHDFRPSYRQILRFLHAVEKKNSDLKVLALTATADSQVEQDIKNQIAFANTPVTVLRESMNRPNIALSAVGLIGIAEKLAYCETLLQNLNGCGLIYCATRENTELVADYLHQQGYNVAAYHAGFNPVEKRKLQMDFIADKYKAIAATNALGMGIDKSNLRFIIHFDFPGSITAYYQEVGRCGRDGLPSQGILLFDLKDKKIQQHFIDSAQPKLKDFEDILEIVRKSTEPVGLTTIKRLTGLHPTKVSVVIAELLEQEFLAKYSYEGKQVYKALPKTKSPDLSRYANQYQVKNRELTKMVDYGELAKDCRMSILRIALGDIESQNCRKCDNCTKQYHQPAFPPGKIHAISKWLDNRPVPIQAYKLSHTEPGMSVLSSVVRSPLFVQFMKMRMSDPITDYGIEEELFLLITKHLNNLARQKRFSAVVPIPSRTWKGRLALARSIGQELKIPVFEDLLTWMVEPPKRQGELLNNDQRNYNVHNRMQANAEFRLSRGAVLLLDDYIGSGSTIKEAGRVLHGLRYKPDEVIPFTVAAVKWQLGKPGFV